MGWESMRTMHPGCLGGLAGAKAEMGQVVCRGWPGRIAETEAGTCEFSDILHSGVSW